MKSEQSLNNVSKELAKVKKKKKIRQCLNHVTKEIAKEKLKKLN